MKDISLAIKLLALSVFSFFVSLSCYASEVRIADQAAAEIKYNIDRYEQYSEIIEMENDFRNFHSSHQKDLMSIAETSYKVQGVMTIVVFLMVLVLVLGGFYLSYLQFKMGGQKHGGECKENRSELKISKSGLEFNSSVIGLVILFMSFMFFYLYVKNVYPIQVNYIDSVKFSSDEGPYDEAGGK